MHTHVYICAEICCTYIQILYTHFVYKKKKASLENVRDTFPVLRCLFPDKEEPQVGEGDNGGDVEVSNLAMGEVELKKDLTPKP